LGLFSLLLLLSGIVFNLWDILQLISEGGILLGLINGARVIISVDIQQDLTPVLACAEEKL
jgi:hypothetical protein